jgi:polar amino acid transport system substrate-binding protein
MRRRSLTACLAAVAACSMASAASAASLAEIKQSGKLRVAVYNEYAPFSDEGRGIDVDVARALAERLGVAAEIVGFRDADSVEDDLRNVIWKGHYLRQQKLADVMMHVPVDPVLASRNDQVTIGAPYFRERLVVARNVKRIPQLVTLQAFQSEKVGVQFDTVEDHFLMNAYSGAFRENVVHFATIAEAAAALKKNEVAAVMGRQTHIEAALGTEASAFAIGPVSSPGLGTSGWNVGVAVKAEFADLAAAVDKAMAELRADGTIERIFTARGVTYAAPSALALR